MPLPVVTPTEMWEERQYTWFSGAQRSYMVPNVTSDTAALGAVAAAFGITVNAQHPDDSSMHVKTDGLAVKWTGPTTAVVVVTWAVGTFADNNDPLLWAPKVHWQEVYDCEAVDVDADGNPIINTAGDPVSPPPTNETIRILLTVTRNESNFNLAKSIQFANTVNSDNVNPFGVGALLPGQMFCRSIVPGIEYRARPLPPYLPIIYSFEMRKGYVQDSDGLWDAFKWRMLNQGLNGWCNPSSTQTPGFTGSAITGEFRNAKGTQVSKPILLDVDGTPFLDAGYLVGGTLAQPIANPNALDSKLIEKGNLAVFLKYNKKRRSQFNSIGIFT